MRLTFAVCSEGVSLDRYTNKLSIFSVIDQRSSLTFPFWMQRFSLVVSLVREQLESEAISGKILLKIDGDVDAESDVLIPFEEDGTARAVYSFNLRVDKPGRLSFHLETEGHEFWLYEMPITKIETDEIGDDQKDLSKSLDQSVFEPGTST